MVVAKHYDRVSETPYFPGEIDKKSPQIANYYGDSKLLRRSILVWQGPLGKLGASFIKLILR